MMTGIITTVGLLLILAGCVILANPQRIYGPLTDNIEKPALQIAAVLVRLALGFLLISQATVSKFPLVIEVLGWLSVVAALGLAVIGRGNFTRLMKWALTLVKPLGRASGFVVVAFGAFLVYAFV